MMILLIIPSLAVITVVMFYPLFYAFYLSFYRCFLTDPGGRTFFGMGNYERMIRTPEFWIAFKNTLVYVGGVVFLELIIGFAIAMLLNLEIKYRNIFRALFMFPWVTPSVVVALLTLWMFNRDFGVVNVILKGLGIITSFKPWIKDPSLAMFTMLIVTTWKFFPFMLIVLLAGLQTIPVQEMEAARIDGANAMQRFLHITLPHMRELIMIVTLLEFIWNFQYITVIWNTTKGGPVYATTTFPVLIYRAAFREFNLGYGASIGVFWLLFLLAFAIIYIRVIGGREELMI